MNPTTGHPLDCACCRIQISRTSGSGRKRAREDADLSTFLPEEPPGADPDPEEEGEDEGEGEGEEEGEGEGEEPGRLINEALFKSFEKHVENLDAARLRRIEALSFKSALEDDGQEEVNEDATQDEIDGLGVWLPGDEFQGDVNYRTLQKLLTRVDQRGFERSAQQLEFHVAFMKAAARVIYRGSWETERPAIMKKFGWEKSNSEKTFSIAIFCACLALAFGLEIVVFSPARRASRKLLERIVEYPPPPNPPQHSSLRVSQTWPLAGLCDWPAATSASASTTRRAVPHAERPAPSDGERSVRRRRAGSMPSTVASRSSARSHPK